MGIAWGFDGEHATDVRPPHSAASKAWAKNESAPGANDGTRLTAGLANRIVGNIRTLVNAAGSGLTETSDEDVLNAVTALIGATPPAPHNHDSRYYQQSAVDALLATRVPIASIVDNLASTSALVPLSAAQGKVLKDLIDGLGDITPVADLAEASTLTGLDRGDLVHVGDNGAGKWARYQVTAAGDGTWAGSTRVLLWTQDQAPATHGHVAGDITDSTTDGRAIVTGANFAAIRTLLGLSPPCANRAALAAIDTTKITGAYLCESGREGDFVWKTGDFAAQISADTAEGLYIKANSVAASAGAWVRVYDGPVLVSWFGVSAASADNTAAYDALIATVPSGASLLFPPSQTLLGHFVTSKGYNVDLNGSMLVNISDTTAILQLGAVTPTAHNVTEATLAHGDRSFTITGASGLFAAGEIGYLWDSAVRPSDSQPVNYECVRIAGVSGDVVTVEGFLHSYKGAGAIKFYHSPDQIRHASIINGFGAPTPSHTWPVFSIWNCYDATVQDLDVAGGRGNAVSLRNSYDVAIENTALRKPSGTGSGEGYGTAVLTCTKVRGRKIYGDGARHAYDQDSTYDFEIDGVTDWSPASAACVIAHNGFAAYGKVRNVRTRVADYAITYSAQGFGTGAGNALRQNHPAREVYIESVHHVVPSTMDANASFTSIYIQTDVSGGVSDCTLRFENATAVSNTSPSRLLRVTGAMVGEYHVENLDANRVGSLVFTDNYANGPAGVGACYIRNLRCPETRIPVWLRGDWGVDVDGLWLGTVAGDQLVLMDTLNGDAPLFAAVGASIRYSGTDREIIRTSQATTGTKATIARLSSSSVSVVAGDAISLVNVQNRDAMFTLVTPTGAGTCTLSATDALPAPQINGAELYIRTVSGRNDAVFPAGNNINGGFTITAGGAARLVAYGGKWVATVY